MASRVRTFFLNFVLIGVSVVVAALLGEVVLRVAYPPPYAYFIRRPNEVRVVDPKPEFLPGISGEASFTSSSMGLRADEIGPEHEEFYLVFGGSTAECMYLDDTEAWPWLIQDLLNKAHDTDRYWIGNAGVSGQTSRQHVYQMHHLLRQMREVKTALVLVGANDLQLTTRSESGFEPVEIRLDDDFLKVSGDEFGKLRSPFMLHPEHGTDSWENTGYGRLLRRLNDAVVELPKHRSKYLDKDGANYNQWRVHRRESDDIIDTLPDLSAGLHEYRRNLNMMIDIAQRNDCRLILLTQPTSWREDMPADEVALLWMGGIGDHQSNPGCTYYTPRALAEGIDTYNQALVDVCEQRGAEYIDLANIIPKSSEYFFDDMHFNEAGARLMAESIVEYLEE